VWPHQQFAVLRLGKEMIPSKNVSVVVPFVAETENGDEENREEFIHQQKEDSYRPVGAEREPICNHNKKRVPSQAYMQSAKSNNRLTRELNKKSLQSFEYHYPVIITRHSQKSILAGLERVGWKTLVAAIFLVAFSFGILIGTFASINSLPRQGFYLFLMIGFIVFVPACYAVYTVLGKFYQW
jgi:hypothetical protein